MIREVTVKSILNKHKKRDEWFLDDYSVNPYMACAFNCIYCYIRGSKYGENMSKNLSVKINAPEVLERQLRRRAKNKEYGIIALSTSTDPYQKIEERYKLTRRLLEIILEYRFPVHILTKSNLVLRDLDLLKEIDKRAILPTDLKDKLERGVIINFSISTLKQEIAQILEPGAPPPVERLETMRKCKAEGLFSGVSFIPVLPFISDSSEELDSMIGAAKEYGADFVFVGALTLFGNKPGDCKTLYYRFLDRYYPELVPKYKALYRIFFAPSKKYQNELAEKASRICEKYDIKSGILS